MEGAASDARIEALGQKRVRNETDVFDKEVFRDGQETIDQHR